MNNYGIRWKVFPRDVLTEALFGASPANQLRRSELDRYDLLGGNVAAGFSDARENSQYHPPCLLVIDDESAAETFSWLKVYVPETSPLSQFARVVSAGDWTKFGMPLAYSRQHGREDRWASVIVGETLAQVETDVELAMLPLSRASACFSTAMARAASIYGTDDATRTCADRLRLIEVDRRFVRRLVSVNDLLPIWALARLNLEDFLPVHEAVDLVLEAAIKYAPDRSSRASISDVANLRIYPEFSSDSIEERVLAFQRLANELIHSDGRNPRNGVSGALLAAAAFLVGRSTSHEFLLRRVARSFPVAPAWFGLIAALAGPRAWDSNWTRATKGIERQIRSNFDWSEVSGFDLCWTEFAWLAGTFDGPDIFLSLPKLIPRAVSVEILPGATCQFRLASAGSPDADARLMVAPSEREGELKAALAQFIGLAARTKQLLDEKTTSAQQSLPLDDENSSNLKGSRSRRTKPRS